jgi:hypothetical protein
VASGLIMARLYQVFPAAAATSPPGRSYKVN